MSGFCPDCGDNACIWKDIAAQMTPLRTKDIDLDHPCAGVCSGWKQGYEKGYARGHKRAIEHLVSAMTKLLDPEVMEFIEKSIVRKGLQSGQWEIFGDTERRHEPKGEP